MWTYSLFISKSFRKNSTNQWWLWRGIKPWKMHVPPNLLFKCPFTHFFSALLIISRTLFSLSCCSQERKRRSLDHLQFTTHVNSRPVFRFLQKSICSSSYLVLVMCCEIEVEAEWEDGGRDDDDDHDHVVTEYDDDNNDDDSSGDSMCLKKRRGHIRNRSNGWDVLKSSVARLFLFIHLHLHSTQK